MGRGGQQGWGWWVSEAGRSGRASPSTDPRAGGREQLEHLVKMRKNTTACGLEHGERGEQAGEEGESGVVSQGWGCGFLSKCDRACGVLWREAPGLIYILQGSLCRWDRTSGTAFHGPALTHRLRGRPVPLKDAQILGWRCHV